LVGVVGVLIAALTALLPEPRRRHSALARGSAAEEKPGGAGFFDFLRAAAFFLVPFVIGCTLFNMFVNGFVSWLPAMFVRTYQWSLAEAGSAVGSAILLTGLAGGPLGAFLARLIARRRHEDGAIIVLILSATGLIGFAVLSPLASEGSLALAGVVIALGLAMFAMVVAPAAILNSAPPGMRARVSALYLLIANLIGVGAGPALYALSTDYVFRDPGRLNHSISLVSAGLLSVTLLFLLVAQARYGRVMRLAESFEGHNAGRGKGA
jgi:MFS family permease